MTPFEALLLKPGDIVWDEEDRVDGPVVGVYPEWEFTSYGALYGYPQVDVRHDDGSAWLHGSQFLHKGPLPRDRARREEGDDEWWNCWPGFGDR